MKVGEAKKISKENKGEPFCICLDSILEQINYQARYGFYNCHITVPSQQVDIFEKELKKLGFLVFSEKFKDSYLSKKYSNYCENFHLLDISWF
jgi:hypothetical protein